MNKNKKDQNDAIVNVRHNTFGFIMFWVALLLLLVNEISYTPLYLIGQIVGCLLLVFGVIVILIGEK